MNEDYPPRIVERYLQLLLVWCNLSCPHEITPLLEHLWVSMSSEEKRITVELVTVNLEYYMTSTKIPGPWVQSSTTETLNEDDKVRQDD